MRNYLAVAVLLLLCLALLSGSACARDWFVSNSGSDSNDGTIGSPKLTIQAAYNSAAAGDIVQVRAGTYASFAGSYHGGAPGAYLTVRAYDGDLTAHVGPTAFIGCSYVRMEGLDFANNDSNCTNVHGYWNGVGYDRNDHIQFKRCRFTVTDTNSTQSAGDEIFKASQSDYLLIEDCELTVAGTNPKTSVAIDFVWCSYSTARRVYIHDYHKVATYWKGGSMYDTLEDSVIANARTNFCPTNGVAIGCDGSGWSYANPDTLYGQEYTVARNNIIRGNTKAGLVISSSNWAWVYNNLIADVATMTSPAGCIGYAWGYVNCMTYPAGDHGNGMTPNHTRFFNNILLDTAGVMTKAYQNQLGGALDFVTGNNCYYNNGNAVPAGDLSGVDPATESGAVFANPNLTLSGTPTSWQGWVDYYRPTSNSTAIRDAGNSNAGVCPRPGVIRDIEGNGRPRGGGWDIGPYEWPGSYNTPVADFTGAPTTGEPSLGVDFQDCTTGAPTSWSWSFGDSSTSTAQNPSHLYTAVGNYTVALTATNSAGNDTETKTGYIVVKPVTAKFTVSTTWGAAPLSVTFSDQSTGTPTAWSWTFGDGGSSTAQNPSHTYSTAGTYSVSLTASNSLGSDVCTKSDYMAACTETTYTPTDWRAQLATSTGRLMMPSCGSVGNIEPSAGTLSNLAAKDGSYLEFPSHYDSQWGYQSFVGFYVDTPYTAAQIKAVRCDATARSTSATSPGGIFFMYDTADRICKAADAWMLDWWTDPWGSNWRDQGKSFGPTQLATLPGLVSPTGELQVTWYAGGTTSFSTQFDYVQFTVWSVPSSGPTPPVADFSGTPLSGLRPLAVSFTDSSTNTPTSWSWSFGDSSTSTAQNPSHTYTASGTYTVSLTAANAGGNDSETKTNYVTVTDTVVCTPSACTPGWGATLVSGTLADLATSNNSYMVFADATYSNVELVDWTTGYTPSQVSKLHLDLELHDSGSACNGHSLAVQKTNNDWVYQAIQAFGYTTTDVSKSWESTDVSTYLFSDGAFHAKLCACGTASYTVSVDQLTLTLTVAGGGSAPVANFSGTPTSGSVPLGVSFTDSSTNTPTSWSWTFGDGGSSTAQNPSHTYTSTGTYTVALTATNSSGSDGETKTNYITALPPAPVADFSATPTSGLKSLAVSFTDSSTNTPTSWSWSFGDSSTSTAQNPSHTYTSAGTYTVALTATNAGGNDVETKTGYINVTDTVVCTPSGYSAPCATSLTSGTLSDVATSNDAYMVFTTCGAGNTEFFDWSTGYTPSQLSKLRLDIELHDSGANCSGHSVAVQKSNNDWAYQAIQAFAETTSDVSKYWESTDVSTYLYSNGAFHIKVCACGTAPYTVSVDKATLTLTGN